MFQGLIWLFQLIFSVWTSPTCDLGEVNKATLLVVAGHCEIIFCILTCRKCDFNEVEKAMIPVFECTLKTFSAS